MRRSGSLVNFLFIVGIVVIVEVVFVFFLLVFLLVVVVLEVIVIFVGEIHLVGAGHDQTLPALGAADGVTFLEVVGVNLVEITLRAGRHTGSMQRIGRAPIARIIWVRKGLGNEP